MRVLRLCPGFDPRHGGPAHSMLLSVLATRAAGIDVDVATLDEGFASAVPLDRLRAAGVSVHTFPPSRLPRASRLGISPALARWTVGNAGRFDVIHAHGAWTATTAVGLVAARLRGVPLVLTAHESLTEHDILLSGRLGRLVKRSLRLGYGRLLDAIVFASTLERRDSRGEALPWTRVIAHPIELPDVAPRSSGSSSFRVGFLGRFDPKKNLDVLLRSLPPDVELIVGGEGPSEQGAILRKVAAHAGVESRLTWLGFIDQGAKSEFFRSIDVLAMPSRYECFGMAAAEALAAGVPVVVSPATGIAPIVTRYECGFIVEPKEEFLRAALTRRNELREMAARARSAAESELDLEKHGRALLGLYGSIRKVA